MMSRNPVSRRSFLAASAGASLAMAVPQSKRIPVGLELFSVRGELAKDLKGTVTAVAKQGYEVVEFFSPYFNWTPDYAKEVRKLLDDLGIKCNSTHNGAQSFSGDGVAKAIELNKIIGSRYIVMASPPRLAPGQDGWKKVGDLLTEAQEKFRPAGIRGGYHNHASEWDPVDGKKPIEIIAANTPKDFMLQLDVGTCVEKGQDPVAWVNANPGRINSMHLKDWTAGTSPDRAYRVLFGEGDVKWKQLLAAAEKTGGVEYYLIEQEGSRFPELETAEKCLAAYKKMRAS